MPELDDILARMNRQVAEAERRKAEFCDWFNEQAPQPVPCSRHPQCMTEPDFAESWAAALRLEQPVVAYGPCADCAAERAAAQRSDVMQRVVGVPPNISHARFGNYQPETPAEESNWTLCQQWADSPAGFLLMHGNTGTGKTHLATAILAASSRPCRYREHKQMVDELRADYERPLSQRRFERTAASPLLCWDEFGFGANGSDVPDMIHNTLNHREKHSLPTIIAFNGTLAQFKLLVGDRMESRIRGNLYCEPLLFDGRDRRVDRPKLKDI